MAVGVVSFGWTLSDVVPKLPGPTNTGDEAVATKKKKSRKRKGTRDEVVEFHDNPLVPDEEDNESASPKDESAAQE